LWWILQPPRQLVERRIGYDAVPRAEIDNDRVGAGGHALHGPGICGSGIFGREGLPPAAPANACKLTVDSGVKMQICIKMPFRWTNKSALEALFRVLELFIVKA
jgi:hypothetical protein